MLEAICGSKSVVRILLFLFVNHKCYGAQMHKLLQLPLTPLQKSLQKLERGGILVSSYEGKTRIYRLNPAFPLLEELELLLKKAYTLLPSQQKKDFYFVEKSCQAPTFDKMQVLLNFWDQLGKISQLSFQSAKAVQEGSLQDTSGWEGKGYGEVRAVKQGDRVLVFYEKGSWSSQVVSKMAFSNVFRWTLDRYAGVITLEHLRHGADHPVFLFHVAPAGPSALASMGSHLCGEDTYLGHIHFDEKVIHLNWRVIGPKKNEEIRYHYFGV